ncbi:MAG TPA: ABC transporter permease [Thermoplasmata archaeon]|nr:ABC transporter permease [Thermoplasmata archaeon]
MGRSPSDLIVFVGKRILQVIPVLFGVVTLTFLFTHLATQNPCATWLGAKATKSALKDCRVYFGLDYPPWVQYERYLAGLVSGNWGVDTLYHSPVLSTILSHFPETLELVLASVVLMVVVGIPLGVVAAASGGRVGDHLVRLFYLSGWATPTYLAGAVLAIGVGSAIGLGTGDFSSTPSFPQPTHMSVLDALLAGNIPATGDAIAHLILPATALAFVNMGIATRMTRSSMLEVLPLDFVKTARMKGLSEFAVLYKHALRNALITTTTVLAVTAGGMIASTVVIEQVFQWPGVGQYAYAAIFDNDFSGVIGVVIFFSVVVVLANLIADVLYGILDPRVEWR